MSGYHQPPNPTGLTDLHKAELEAAGIPTNMDKSEPTTVSNIMDRRGQPLTPPQSPIKARHPQSHEHIHFANAGDNAGDYSDISQTEQTGEYAPTQPADVQPPSQDEPTFSHALAAEHNPSKIDGVGAEGPDGQKVAIHHKDIGSHRGDTQADSEGVWGDPAELVHGKMTKEDFWVLVRRFNKQVYGVQAIEKAPPGGLDLNISDEEEFNPDKLRSNLERLYMTVIIGLINFTKHIVRIRSWKETRRTAAFCTVYFAAWFFHCIIPLSFTVLTLLVAYPPARAILFPPAPIALVNKDHGGIQKPSSGQLGSDDTVTGAPEVHKGEAAEQEAYNFTASLGTVIISSATGEHPTEDNVEGKGDSQALSRKSVAGQIVDTKAAGSGQKADKAADKSKKPMEAAVWEKARPGMRALADICDIWERFANALSPTPPFTHKARYQIAAIFAPLALISLFIHSAWVMRSMTFLSGATFFGQPGIDRILDYLNTHYPNWMELLDLRNTLLLHVPTNAQLTVTLLRIGEANHAPLPPPPRTNEIDPDDEDPTHRIIDIEDVPLDASQDEMNAATMKEPQSPPTPPEHESTGSKIKSSLLGFFKGTTKTGVQASVATSHIKASLGSKSAKEHLGAIPKPSHSHAHAPAPPSTPSEFKCRFNGHRGYAVLSTTATIPCLSFSRHRNKEGEPPKEVKPEWAVPLKNIQEIRKIGGFAWPTKLIVGWAMERQVADGLLIVERDGTKWDLRAMPGRDELFNRLISVGEKVWECL